MSLATKQSLSAGVKGKMSGRHVNEGAREFPNGVAIPKQKFDGNGDSGRNDDGGDSDIAMSDLSDEEGQENDLDMELFGDGFRELIITSEARRAMSSIEQGNQEYVFLVAVIRTYPNYEPCITLHSIHSSSARATATAKRHFKSLYPSIYASDDPLIEYLQPNGHFIGRQCILEEYYSSGSSESESESDSDKDSINDCPKPLPEIEITSASRLPLIQPAMHDPWGDPEYLSDEGHVFVVFVQVSSSARPGQTSRGIRGVYKYRDEANDEAENQVSMLVGELCISDWFDGCYRGERVYVNCQTSYTLVPLEEVVISLAYVEMVRVRGWEVWDPKEGGVRDGYEDEEDEDAEMEVQEPSKEEEKERVKAISKYMTEKAMLNVKEKSERDQERREKRRKRKEKEQVETEHYYTLPDSDGDESEDSESKGSIEAE